MRRFLGNLVGKALTGKSTDDRNQENFTNFCLANNILNTNMKKYRIDRDPQNPNFWEQTYIGTCMHGNGNYGLIVSVSEYTGFTNGELFLVTDVDKRDDAVLNYKINNQGYPEFYLYWSSQVSEHVSLKMSSEYRYSD